MSNPWLAVPLSEYERHMISVRVGQLEVLSDLFSTVVRRCRPKSVAILGIAGGNGLDHIDRGITSRVVGIDLNPVYLEAVRRRYPGLPGLDLRCADLSEKLVDLEPVQLVHAALIFEHVGIGRCLENATSIAAPGGNLSVVLQLPADGGEPEVASRFSSIRELKPHFSLVSPACLCQELDERGFHMIHRTTRLLPGRKGFWMGIFSAPISSPV
ncbi:MAG TPA: class I SAM-dependent methyltransferase [Terriglobia bacterium]|nr:class I SAM-dependent methyltransferase [Terriglobia bacterium]